MTMTEPWEAPMMDSYAAERGMPFRIVCALTGDEAEAETAEAALLAAATLVDDDAEANPIQGRTKAARNSLYIVENGTYCGILTVFAREGYRGPLA